MKGLQTYLLSVVLNARETDHLAEQRVMMQMIEIDPFEVVEKKYVRARRHQLEDWFADFFFLFFFPCFENRGFQRIFRFLQSIVP